MKIIPIILIVGVSIIMFEFLFDNLNVIVDRMKNRNKK